MRKHHKSLNSSLDDRIFNTVVYIISAMIIIITLYPILYVFSLSFSSKQDVIAGRVWLYPVNFTLAAYKLFFSHPLLVHSYGNTIFYTVAGTAYSVLLTVIGGYVLSKRNLIGRNALMLLITFTMLFGGGIIPTFLVVKSLGMYNSIWAMIIPCAVSPWNLIIVRTSMKQIPESLAESAVIDGANEIHILTRIILPLSKPVIATISLFYAVGIWNDYFSALIYLNNQNLYPVQLVVRGLLVSMSDNLLTVAQLSSKSLQYTPMSFKSAVVIVTMMPILLIYPFIQKYFVKGVMIGAIKG